MLWQKESETKDALYIDLCKPLSNKIDEFKEHNALYKQGMLVSIERNFIANKDDDFSLKLRQEGNALFGEKKWDKAMDKYNRSLCFAQNNSEHIGLAYANRSSCFFNLKMYDQCLIDIDLAKKGNYPEDRFPKLETRTMRCVNAIDNGLQAVISEAKLSNDPHKHYPQMVKNLVIATDSKYGRHVVTTKDIDVGETVLLEKMYVGESYVRKYETCTVCLKSNTNLMPCHTCTFAMLCYDGCQCADLHRLECGIRKYPNEGDDFTVGMIIPIVRSILMAMKLFPNTFNLMNFVEDAIASDPMEIPTTTADDKSMYRAFLQVSKQGLNDIKPIHIHLYYEALLNQTELAPHFFIEKYQRFFMHLIMHHVAVFKSNKITNKRLIGNVSTYLYEISYVYEDDCMGILKTYFNHSCAPNITFYCDNGSIIGKIILPVKNGEQLFVSYYDNLLGLKWNDRQDHEWDFKCDCFRCQSGVDDNTDEHEDPDFYADFDYFYIRQNFSPNRSYPDESKRKRIEEICIKLLKKFGRNKWSYSLEFIMQGYVAALERSTSSPISKYHYLTNIVEKAGLHHTVDMFQQEVNSCW